MEPSSERSEPKILVKGMDEVPVLLTRSSSGSSPQEGSQQQSSSRPGSAKTADSTASSTRQSSFNVEEEETEETTTRSSSRAEGGGALHDGGQAADCSSTSPAYLSSLGAILNLTNCILGNAATAALLMLDGQDQQTTTVMTNSDVKEEATTSSSQSNWTTIVAILVMAVISKLSVDMLIRLSRQDDVEPNTDNHHADDPSDLAESAISSRHQQQVLLLSYEDLSQWVFGFTGQAVVVVTKFLYSFACTVAFLFTIKIHLASSLKQLLFENNHVPNYQEEEQDEQQRHYGMISHFLSHPVWVTGLVSVTVLLPLCLLPEMRHLVPASAISMAAMMICIILILLHKNEEYLSPVDNNTLVTATSEGDATQWLYAPATVLSPSSSAMSLGTLVTMFVSHHVAHLIALALPLKSQRTLFRWKQISTVATALSTFLVIALSYAIDSMVRGGPSDQNELSSLLDYKNSESNSSTAEMSLIKFLLCVVLLMSFPLPFSAARELLVDLLTLITMMMMKCWKRYSGQFDPDMDGIHRETDHSEQTVISNSSFVDSIFASRSNSENDLEEPLLEQDFDFDDARGSNTASEGFRATLLRWYQKLAGTDRQQQLKFMYHIFVSFKLWKVVTGLAVLAPSSSRYVGNILDVLQCAFGTVIAFILPACLALQLQQQILRGRHQRLGEHHQLSNDSVHDLSSRTLLALGVGGLVGLIGTLLRLKELVEGRSD